MSTTDATETERRYEANRQALRELHEKHRAEIEHRRWSRARNEGARIAEIDRAENRAALLSFAFLASFPAALFVVWPALLDGALGYASAFVTVWLGFGLFAAVWFGVCAVPLGIIALVKRARHGSQPESQH